ncbi:perosamine synthetase [Candidatus Marinamargulisbacteria bacterium SCGC AG-333-B06]|nr:perosamine synthetase [Candidatus Marinamargulisbacteria bacterium SCGC AG-333-B06]
MTTSTHSIFISQPSVGEDEYKALEETLLSGWITQGPKVKQFENEFSAYHNLKKSLATTSCTTALHVILKTLGIKAGDEVIVPAFTWVASANVIEHCGATPIFVDIDCSTFNLDPTQLNSKITSKTKAIIAVHLFGLCADIENIQAIAGDIPIIEDAACAVGSKHPNGYAGALGTAGAFSFHPRKTVTTGEGGMVTTNDLELAQKIDILRNHGASISEEKRHLSNKPYILPDFDVCGFNYRMTDIQASIGIAQLQKLNDLLAFRQQWAAYYTNELDVLSWITPPVIPTGYYHGWQSYVCMIDESLSPYPRNKIMEILQEKGISTRPGTHAVHMLKYYKKKYNLNDTDFPNAYTADQHSISIPFHNKMTKKDFQYIVKTLKEI